MLATYPHPTLAITSEQAGVTPPPTTRTKALMGATIGGLIGAIAGVVLGEVVYSSEGPSSNARLGINAGNPPMVAALVTGVGAILGAVIATPSQPVEQTPPSP
jgi:hypothetical protein